MFANREDIKELIIAVCDNEWEKLEEMQENEMFDDTDIDIEDCDIMDLITYIHRFTAEEYVKRAKKVLENTQDEKNEDIKRVVYSIVPVRNFASLEFNAEGYKGVEHYF